MNNQNPQPTPARRITLIKTSIKASSAKINNLLKSIKATSELHNFKLARVQTVRGYDNSASLLTEEIERDASTSAIAQELLRMLLRQQNFSGLKFLSLGLSGSWRMKTLLTGLEAADRTLITQLLGVAASPCKSRSYSGPAVKITVCAVLELLRQAQQRIVAVAVDQIPSIFRVECPWVFLRLLPQQREALVKVVNEQLQPGLARW